jgi:hypothetical protein
MTAVTRREPEYALGMRAAYPKLCWRLLNGGERACILGRGHDNGIHEYPTEDNLREALERIVNMQRFREAEELPTLAFNMAEVAREALAHADESR